MRRVPQAFATRRGWARSGLPPLTARHRLGVVALTLGAAVVLITGCSSSAQEATSKSDTAAATIPKPFEVGQQVGAGDVSLQVRSFRHEGGDLSAVVDVTNEGTEPITIVPARSFGIFYGSKRYDAVRVDGSGAPIPAGSTSSYTATFTVPARYQFPLLWFTTGGADAQATTVVLRKAAAG